MRCRPMAGSRILSRMTCQYRRGNSVDSVLVDVALQPVDSIEKIYMTVAVSVNAESV